MIKVGIFGVILVAVTFYAVMILGKTLDKASNFSY